MKTPDFMSYDRYKKKQTKESTKNGLLIGLTTFFITLFLFTLIAKSLSPDVDVTIGDDSATDAKETGLGVKRFIDERLKSIQMEDNSAGVSVPGENPKTKGYNDESFNKYSQELEEKIELPTTGKKHIIEESEDEGTTYSTPPRPSTKEAQQAYQPAKMSKVLVGRYATVEQAKVAQGILIDSGIDITPFIKDMGGSYSLQVGSYSSRAKAEGVASELQNNGFPTRIIQE